MHGSYLQCDLKDSKAKKIRDGSPVEYPDEVEEPEDLVFPVPVETGSGGLLSSITVLGSLIFSSSIV